jgi:hypothetical protein
MRQQALTSYPSRVKVGRYFDKDLKREQYIDSYLVSNEDYFNSTEL